MAYLARGGFPAFDKIARDVDAEDLSAQSGLWQGRRPVAASQVQNFHSRVMPRAATTASPLSRMLGAMRVKSPFPIMPCSDSLNVVPPRWRSHASKV